MSNQHTPGPWRMAEYHIVTVPRKLEIAGQLEAVDLQTYRPISIAYATPGIRDGLANARLIAAAPDLLAALESFVHNYRTSEDMVSAFQRATEAIAKAKG